MKKEIYIFKLMLILIHKMVQKKYKFKVQLKFIII